MERTSMKPASMLAAEYLRELEAEARATRECLERVPAKLFSWKPHEKSMELGYMAKLIAGMPRWISSMIKHYEIELSAYEQAKETSTEELLSSFDHNLESARSALRTVTDDELKRDFHLKSQGKTLFTSPIDETISSTINHLVHHRGQLTVYLRLNDIAVPSIYGPSADDRTF